MAERLFQCVMLLAGIAIFAQLWRLGRKADQSRNWPVAIATILESSVLQRTATVGGDHAGVSEYLAQVRYGYQVQGRDYQSSNRRFPQPGYGRNLQEAEQIVQRYPVGATVRSSYNPANPAEACLETGQHWTVWAGKAIALLIILIALGLLLQPA